MTGPRLVIFDCDGTLVDSQNVICAAMEMAFTNVGLAMPARESVLEIVGLSLPEAIARVKETNAIPHDAALLDALLEEYKQAFAVLRQDPSLKEPMFPGVREGILALAARDDMLLGIATGKSRRGVDRFLRHNDLAGCFTTIQTADDAPSKPHPAMIEQAMVETGADPAATLMVGDTRFDMAMARSAGVAGLGVAWGYHPPESLYEAGAAAVAADFPALLAAIEEYLGAPEAVR